MGVVPSEPFPEMSAAGKRIVIVQKHEKETRNDDDSSEPSEGVGRAPFVRIHGLPIGEYFPESKSRCEPACVGPIVDSHAHEAEHEKNDNRTDQSRAQLAHVRPAPL